MALRWPSPRRKAKFTPFDRSSLPSVKPPTTAEMVAEGLLVAEAAARMSLRNRFVVGALRGGDDYDPDLARAAAADIIYELVQEADDAAEKSAANRRASLALEGRAKHQHDYRSKDAANLRRREDAYAAIAKRLWALRDDPEYLDQIAERAREDAWHDVASAIGDRLDREWPEIEMDAEYHLARPERMNELALDLDAEIRRATERRARQREQLEEAQDPFAGYVG